MLCRQSSPSVGSLLCFSLQRYLSVGSLLLLPAPFFFFRQQLLSAIFSFCWHPTCSVRILLLLSVAFSYCRHPSSSVSSLFLLSSAFFFWPTTFFFCRQPFSVSNLLLSPYARFSVFLPAAFSFYWQPTSFVDSILLAAFFVCRRTSPSVDSLLLLWSTFFSYCVGSLYVQSTTSIFSRVNSLHL